MSDSQKRGRHRAPPAVAEHGPHRGTAVRVGPYNVWAGGTQYLQPQDLSAADVLVPLTGCEELEFGQTYTIDGGTRLSGVTPFLPGRTYTVLCAKLKDFGGVPANWKEFLEGQVIPLLQSGKRLMPFCIGSHGRTGTFLASLIALLEPEVADPIAAARKRHCVHAVETRAQAEAIFALRGQELPKRYQSQKAFHS